MNSKFVKIVQTIGLFLIFAGLFLTCSDPFKAGLGPKVDINPPEIHWIKPESGHYIKGQTITFEANVTDDIKVSKVEIYYRQEVTDNWKFFPMDLDHDAKEWCDHCEKEITASYYNFTLDFNNDEHKIDGREFSRNGDLYMYIIAEDDAGHKTSSESNSYIIKNHPPEISMNSPYLEEEFWKTINHDGQFYVWSLENKPIVFQKADVLGNVYDLQGVMAPYPQIKIWNTSLSQTEESVNWEDIVIDSFIGPSDWATRDDEPGFGGARNIGFKVRAYTRNSEGRPTDTPLPQTGDIPYQFRVRAFDIGDTGTGDNKIVSYYPPVVYDEDNPDMYYPNHPDTIPAAEFFIEVSQGLQTLDLYFNDDLSSSEFVLDVPTDYPVRDPASPYGQKRNLRQASISGDNEFVLEARARHGTGIRKALLGVSTEADPVMKYLPWALDIDSAYNSTDAYPNMDDDPRWINTTRGPEREYLFLSPKIYSGLTLQTITGELDINGDYIFTGNDITFEEALYSFTVMAWEVVAEEIDFTDRGISVQIIDNPPEINFTNINKVQGAGNSTSPDITTLTNDTGDPVIRGTFNTEYSNITSMFRYRFDTDTTSSDDGDSSEWRSGLPDPGSTGKNVRWTIPANMLNDGLHSVSIRITDDLDFQTEVLGVYFRLDTEFPEFDDVDPIYDPDGRKIDLDPAPLNGDYEEPVYGSLAGAGLTFKGTVRDANLKLIGGVTAYYMNSQRVKFPLANLNPISIPDPDSDIIPKPLINEFEFVIDNATYENYLLDGKYSVFIIAEDTAGRQTEVEQIFIRDVTPPAVTFTNINEGPSYTVSNPKAVLVGQNPRVTGSAEDNQSLADWNNGGFRYMIEKYNYIANTWSPFLPPSAGWEQYEFDGNPANLNWSVNLPPATEDGQYRMTIMAKDQTGNSSVEKTAEFFVSRSNPVIEIPSTKSIYGTGNMNFSGTTKAFNDIKSFTAYLKRNQTGLPVEFTHVTWTGSWNSSGSFIITHTPIEDGTRKITQTANASQHFDSWTLDLPFEDPDNPGTKLVGGEYTLTIEITDWADREVIFERPFTLDPDPPLLTITTPSNHARVTGNVTVAGTTWDNDLVQNIYFHVGIVSDEDNIDWQDPSLYSDTNISYGGGVYSWFLNFPVIQNLTGPSSSYVVEVNSDNPDLLQTGSNVWRLPIYIKVVDRAGNETVRKDYFLLVEPSRDKPTVSIHSPSPAAVLGGSVRVTGTSTDDTNIHFTQMRVSIAESAKDLLLSYDTVKYPQAGPTNGLDPEKWTSFTSGVVSRLAYKYPNASIDHIAGVVIRDDLVGDFSIGDSPIDYGPHWFLVNVQGTTLSASTSWFYNINQNGELNPKSSENRKLEVLIEAMALDAKDQSNGHYETNSIWGDIEPVTFELNSLVPTITNVQVEKNGLWMDYSPQIRVAGTFRLKAEIRAGIGLSVINLRRQEWSGIFRQILNDQDSTVAPDPSIIDVIPPILKYPGGFINGVKYFVHDPGDTGYINNDYGFSASNPFVAGKTFVYNSAFGSLPVGCSAREAAYQGDAPFYPILPADEQFFVYEVTTIVNSPSIEIQGNRPYENKSGTYSIDLQAYDNTFPLAYQALSTFNFQIDNFYPYAQYTSSVRASGTYNIQGRAIDSSEDSGNIGGLDYVVAWFSRRNTDGSHTPISLDNGPWVGAGNRLVKKMDPILNQNSPMTSVDFPRLRNDREYDSIWDGIKKPMSSNWGIVINDNEVNVDRDGDGVIEGWTIEGSYVDWYGYFNTNRLADGPVTLHYAVVDLAGNTSYYEQDLFIDNNAPKITGVTIGTDLNFKGSVNMTPGNRDNRYIAINYESTNFRVRNKHLSFDITADKGNGTKSYDISYVIGSTNVRADALVVGNVYTISSSPGSTMWTLLGASSNTPGVTFVALASGENLGDATGYAISYELEHLNSASLTSNVLHLGDSAFGTTGNLIRDSIAANDAKFIIKVYDSTVSGGTVADQLSDAVLLGLTVVNDDNPVAPGMGKIPEIRVAPFGQRLYSGLHTTGVNTGEIREDVLIFPIDAPAFPQLYRENIVTENPNTNQPIRHGHVQYAVDKPNGQGTNNIADLSGKVIFLGKAWDDQRVTRITAQIPGYKNGDQFVIAQWDETSHEIRSAEAHNIADMADENSTVEWAFEIVHENNEFGQLLPENTQQFTEHNGHFFNWKFAWDSSLITNAAAMNQTITFRVYDGRNYNAGAGPGNSTGNSNSAAFRADIVPYINEVVTALTKAEISSPSAFNRSALGWYPVREDEIIQIKGFNFNPASQSVIVVDRSGTTPVERALASPTSQQLVNADITEQNSKNHINIRIDNNTTNNDANTIVSGELLVRVNPGSSAIDSVNNKNNNGASNAFGYGYNMEPNGLNNNNLTDDRYLYVWNTGYLLNERVVQSPFMRMDGSSNRYMSYGVYASTNGRLRVMKNNNGSGTDIETAANRYRNTTVAFDSAGDWYVGASNMTSGTNYNFTLFSRIQAGGNSAGSNNGANDNKRRVLLMNNNGNVDEDRVEIPRIVAVNSNGPNRGNDNNIVRIYMSYYDRNSTDNPVVFRLGGIGALTGSNANQTQTFGGNFGYASGAGNSTTGGGTSTWGSYPNINTGGGTDSRAFRQVVANNSTDHQGSKYTAVGTLSNGLPVIAWYDRTNQNLVFSYGSNTPGSTNTIGSTSGTGNNQTRGVEHTSYITTTTTQWQGNARVVHRGAGSHVDMAVDQDDNIHLAYYDVRNGGLYYAFIPPEGTGGSRRPTGAIQTVRVDTYLSAGTKLMINVRRQGSNNVPYISYYHGSFNETANAIRVAWRTNFGTPGTIPQGTNPDNSFTGNWEVMTVPADKIPLTDEFICNGVPTTTTGWAAPTGSNLRSYPTTGTNRINRTVLVGYMTTDYYEGAILKHDLY